jgi:hypothetical protein
MFHLQILLRLIAIGTPLVLQPIKTTRTPNGVPSIRHRSRSGAACFASNDTGICKAAIRCLDEIEASEAVKMGRSRQIFAASLIRYQVSTTGTACLAMAWNG